MLQLRLLTTLYGLSLHHRKKSLCLPPSLRFLLSVKQCPARPHERQRQQRLPPAERVQLRAWWLVSLSLMCLRMGEVNSCNCELLCVKDFEKKRAKAIELSPCKVLLAQSYRLGAKVDAIDTAVPCHVQEPLTDSEIEIAKQPVDEAVKHLRDC